MKKVTPYFGLCSPNQIFRNVFLESSWDCPVEDRLVGHSHWRWCLSPFDLVSVWWGQYHNHSCALERTITKIIATVIIIKLSQKFCNILACGSLWCIYHGTKGVHGKYPLWWVVLWLLVHWHIVLCLILCVIWKLYSWICNAF